MIHHITVQIWRDLLTPLWREKKSLTPSITIAPTLDDLEAKGLSGSGGGVKVTSEFCFDFIMGSAKSSAESHLSSEDPLSGSGGNQVCSSVCIPFTFILHAKDGTNMSCHTFCIPLCFISTVPVE